MENAFPANQNMAPDKGLKKKKFKSCSWCYMNNWWQLEVLVLAMFVRNCMLSYLFYIFQTFFTQNIHTYIVFLSLKMKIYSVYYGLYWDTKYNEYVEYYMWEKKCKIY